jgi:hypothetical protein
MRAGYIRIKKDTFFIWAIILISSLYLIPLFFSPFYTSHDSEAHVARFAAYYSAFQDGQIIPRWAGSLNFNYGTPVFIFYYPLPGYLASILHLSGINLENSFKLLIALSFIGAPLTFYLWAKSLFKEEIAFAGALFYGFAPYHFLDLYVRGDVAESLAFIFVPLVLLFIEKLMQKFELKNVLYGAISYGLLILSHNGVSLMFSPIFFVYIFLRSRNKGRMISSITMMLFGLAASSFFWLPALYEAKFTNGNLFIGNMYKDHFVTINQLISSGWGFGADVTKQGGLSPQIGVLYWIMVLGSLVILFKKRGRSMISYWLVVFFFAAFISLPMSSLIWEQLPLIKKFEFPWRFTGLSSFAACVLSCYVLSSIKSRKKMMGILIVLLISSISFAKINQIVHHNDEYYHVFTGTTYFHGEASPIWTAGDPGKYAKAPVEVIGGKGLIEDLKKKSQIHTYVVDAKDPMSILDNTIYFPGWKVFIDGQMVPIQFQDPNHRGLITFLVPKGKHIIKIEFTESKIRLFADILSLLSWFFFMIIFLFVRYEKLGNLVSLLYNREVGSKAIRNHERKNKNSSK